MFYLYFFFVPLFSPLPPFFEFLLSFLLLGQACVRSVPSIASFLESKNLEGECRLFPLCFLFLHFFPYTPFFFPSFMAKPPASLPSFSRFATVSSPFLQLALCPFPESSKKSEEQEEEASPQEAGIGSLSFFCHSSPFLFFLTKSVLPFSFLFFFYFFLRALIQALEILSLLFLREL